MAERERLENEQQPDGESIMQKSTKTWLWIIGTAIVIGGTVTYIVLQRKKDKAAAGKGKNDGADNGGEKAEAGEGTRGSNDKLTSSFFPLTLGSVGRKVLMLQQALNMKGKKVTIDARYGEETALAQKVACVRIAMGINPKCDFTSADYASLMRELGGEQKVLAEGMKNPTFRNLYNQYQ